MAAGQCPAARLVVASLGPVARRAFLPGARPVAADGRTGLEMARRLKAEHGLDLIIIDYIQLMQGRGRFENRVTELASISRGLKGLAKQLGVPVDSYGVGSSLFQGRFDFTADVVRVDGTPCAKVGREWRENPRLSVVE